MADTSTHDTASAAAFHRDRRGGMLIQRPPAVRQIGFPDLGVALRAGWSDFMAAPTHLLFLAVIYPIAGLLIARATMQHALIPLLFPILAGFALIGPFVGLGLYELSRRREQGLTTAWSDARQIFNGPSIRAALGLGLILALVFAVWLYVAWAIYARLFGPIAPASMSGFIAALFSTREGLELILVGHGIGLAFAVTTLMLTVVSFPLLVDRPAGMVVAVQTSVKAVLINPVVMAAWGLIIAAGLMLGSALLLVGLAVVIPVLGHASWHLYRRVVI